MDYDKNGLAEKYSRLNKYDCVRKYCIDHTYLKHIGDVSGKFVLDLACGDGHFCRPLKKAGRRF